MMKLNNKEKIASFILLTCLFLIIEFIVINYFMLYGLSKNGLMLDFFNNKIFIPAYLLPIIGVFIVFLSAWDYLLNKIVLKKELKKISLKVLEQAFIIGTILALFLFIPSIIISNWFLSLISKIYGSLPGLEFLFNALVQFILNLLRLDNFLIFVLIQNIAGFAIAIFVLLMTWVKFKKG